MTIHRSIFDLVWYPTTRKHWIRVGAVVAAVSAALSTGMTFALTKWTNRNADLTADVASMKGDVAEIKTAVAVIDARGELRSNDIVEMKRDIREIRGAVMGSPVAGAGQ